ncbi:aspartate aminotransferase family protein [Limibacter armeniacum]|uniref:pyridoxal phosphate-dependent decarboxylase family protein n=1 Tax=Limibacter armeniacum TaxID=466084 RepID=UPI002FE61543
MVNAVLSNAVQYADSKQLDLKLLFHHHNENVEQYRNGIEKATEKVVQFLSERQAPFSGITPEELKPLFDGISLEETPLSLDETLEELQAVYLDHAVAFHLPKYAAHLNCPVVIPSLIAEQILSAINSSLDTWDQSAGGTLIEQKIIEWTAERIGFLSGDGVFTSGGSQSNLMATLLMRDHFMHTKLKHNVTFKGLPNGLSSPKIFCSEHSHFSLKKSASLLGLGEDAVIGVPTDQYFRMDIGVLEELIKREVEQGNHPIGIVATAGTTDYGSIDPIPEMAQIACKYDIWLHVDAAVGGGLLLSDRYRYLIDGIELADSVTVDYHKTYFQTVSCSAFVVKRPETLHLISYHADYLNPKEQRDTGIPNQVDKSLQTTRRFDALKVWTTLRMMGRMQLGHYYDKTLELTKAAAALIEAHPSFELLNPPVLHSLVFRFKIDGFDNEDWGHINLQIRKALLRCGSAVIAGTKNNGDTYLKFTVLNPMATEADFEKILALIEAKGKMILFEQA